MDEKRLIKARRAMIAEIERDAAETTFYTGRERFSAPVMAAMNTVPRHKFVAPEDLSVAYANRPQSIGHGQTISQPYMVAVMTDFLNLTACSRVLEIGTGCGYQSAVLASIAGHVYSIEVVAELAAAATRRLAELGYDNITIRSGDGYAGWPDQAPFDAIMVTAAPTEVPDALISQLKPGGRMVIPIGRPHQHQTLLVCAKDRQGKIHTRKTLPVAFVPMV